MTDGDGRGAECFVCTHCHRTFAEMIGLKTHIGMMHKRKVITSGVKRRRGDESKGGDVTRRSSEAVYYDGVSDGKLNDSVSGNDDCLEEHDAVHDRGHDEEHDAMLTEILSSLMVDESDGLQSFVGRNSVGAYLNVLPSWDALDQAAIDLARSGPVPPVDLVATGQLTWEEAGLTAWGHLYKVQLAAMNALHEFITQLDGNGAYKFHAHNLTKKEDVCRRVLQENIPLHQRTARGTLYTPEHMEGAVIRNNPVIDARHLIAISVSNSFRSTNLTWTGNYGLTTTRNFLLDF